MSYHTDHLAWQQRVSQELTASNRYSPPPFSLSPTR